MDIFGWIASVWGFSWGSITDLYHWIVRQIASVYTWIDNILASIGAEFMAIASTIAGYFTEAMIAIGAAVVDAAAFTMKMFGDIYSWATAELYALSVQLGGMFSYFTRGLSDAWNTFTGWIEQLRQWVEQNVLGPLTSWLKTLEGYVTYWLGYILKYIQHPELLVQLLGGYLASAWLALLKQFALPITRFIMNNMRSLADEFVGLLEEIISAIL